MGRLAMNPTPRQHPSMARFLAFSARHWRKAVVAFTLIAAPVAGKAWYDTMRDPVVHLASVRLDGMKPGTRPITAAVISDVHIAGPDMPPRRLKHIVAQINALSPDIVLIAGDLVSEKALATHLYTAEEVVAPLGGLRAPLGVVVVPGNHDHWFGWDSLKTQLAANRVTVLQNEAVQIGPLAIGGVDDAYTGHDDVPVVLAAIERLAGGRLLLTHSPDIAPQVPAEVSLVVAGHTHCGQIRFPLVGAVSHMSRYGDRYGCGKVVEGGRTTIVGAGLGTSVLPVRFGTRPEIWLLTLAPSR